MQEVRVLVVDDQAPFRQAASAVIKTVKGFVLVGTAESGEAAVEAVTALHPDLVLMDVNLPGINGLEATRRITAHPANTSTRVLLVSTYEAEDFGDAPQRCGASGFLSKASFNSERLLEIWQRITL